MENNLIIRLYIYLDSVKQKNYNEKNIKYVYVRKY